MTIPSLWGFYSVWADPFLGFTGLGIIITAISGAYAATKDYKRDKLGTVFLTVLIAAGVLVALGAAKVGHDQAEADRAQAKAERGDLLGKIARLSHDNAVLTAQNKSQHLHLQTKEDATYNAAVAINTETRQIFDGVHLGLTATQETLKTTRSVGNKAQDIESRASSLQKSASSSFAGIERLASPLSNVTVWYDADTNINDALFQTLRAVLLTSKDFSAAPPFSVVTVLKDLQPADAGPGSLLMQSMQLSVEMDRPPFPSTYCVGKPNQMWLYTLGRGDRVLTTTGPDVISFYMLHRLSPPDYNITAGASAAPTELVARTGRIDSIEDLPGSRLVFHLVPSLLIYGLYPSLLFRTDLTVRGITINGKFYWVRFSKARKGRCNVYPYYQLQIPPDWSPESDEIP